MSKLGNDVVYIDKWPWADVGSNWWEYFRRPHPDHEEYETVKDKSRTASMASYITSVGRRTLKHQSNSASGVPLVVVTEEFDRMFNLELESGRFFSPAEYRYGSPKALIGADVAEALLGNINPIGRKVKVSGRYFEIIGKIKPSGDELVNIMDWDGNLFIPYTTAASFINVKQYSRWNGQVAVRAREGVSKDELKDELRGIIRAKRRLKPRADDNFALNEITMVASALDSFFGVLNVIGFLIGGFSILVGGVSVANIMFVSVKERTSLIGVKKALGAKRYIILLEFLIEAIILCVIGGLLGLLMVFGVTQVISQFIPFQIFLNASNAIMGLTISIAIGIIAGFIPALQASRMDPVDAMRS
jgi:putative ABC transport system permease protein